MIETCSLADLLMRGPRGRRLLLEYAIASEQFHDPEYHEDSLSAGVFVASHLMDPGVGMSVQMFGDADDHVGAIAPEGVAQRLASVPLADVTPGLLRECLAESADSARYWQAADGGDVLAATDELDAPLRRVAEHIAASAYAAWWGEPAVEDSQWQVEWDGAPPHAIMADPITWLRMERDEMIEEELVASRERPARVTADWGGAWWLCPPPELPSTTRALFDGSPAGLWCVEDSLGWQKADTRRLGMPAGPRICEVDSADTWADLCARFPINVTALRRHDWYRTTGRDGAWVIPDWASVADEYDAVHLQVQAYLSAAGTVIPVDERTATVIAGWGPDQTFWFTPHVRFLDETAHWTLDESDERTRWVQQEHSRR